MGLDGWLHRLSPKSYAHSPRFVISLQWRHNELDGVSNHQPHDCLLNRLFRRRSKKTSKLRVTGLCEGNSPVTAEFPAQRASNAENVSIWWRHHVISRSGIFDFTHILQDYLTCTWGMLRLIQGQHNRSERYGKKIHNDPSRTIV